ncbi:MAG TPA: phytanoyl-CoA dioxygenase family protein [Tepidisphaeraceae bacterium]|jgi:ectoine hydroxylase-related dioxygenase (phytanoyl-CoA dioxygenase family)|nr:phytanoyl-CoA dioxygenase family protein [Tepidisphaeraceae bacterium]
MTNTYSSSELTSYVLAPEQIEAYRRDGFINLPDVFVGAELAELRDVVAGAVDAESAAPEFTPDGKLRPKGAYEQIFKQKVNLWQRHPAVARFVTSRRLGNLAAQLEGVPMRLWHDQALFKEPSTNNNKTPWHQDAPYWPHLDMWRQTTIWIALKDATVVNGCMAFVGGTHKIGPVPAINLGDPQDIFDYAPHIKPVKPKVVELKAGSATFHNGLTFHYAGPNKSDGVREAFAIIYMPHDTTFNGKGHMVTDGLGLREGQPLDMDLFPRVSDKV